MPRRYVIYDVFTDRALTGNPLAVVLDTDGLDTDAMQAIADEFNLSETTFVGPPENAAHRARVRIFTPAYELPFAGHPTVGTAIALAELDGRDGASLLVLEENIGPVRCAVSRGAGAAFAEFDLAVLPKRLPFKIDAAIVGKALGLAPHEIGFEDHELSQWSAGVLFIAIPVTGLEAARKVSFDNRAWLDFCPNDEKGTPASAYVYCRETDERDTDFHARMFVPGAPSYEDPATGSAAAAFAGAVAAFDRLGDGPVRLWIEQGMEMGRPSRIRLEIEMKDGAIAAARIGGRAVKVGEGVLLV